MFHGISGVFIESIAIILHIFADVRTVIRCRGDSGIFYPMPSRSCSNLEELAKEEEKTSKVFPFRAWNDS